MCDRLEVLEWDPVEAVAQLTEEQAVLLAALVEAYQRVPADRRGDFWYRLPVSPDPRPNVVHEGLPRDFRAAFGDLEELALAGFLRLERRDRNGGAFRLSNNGVRAAMRFARGNAESIEAVEVAPALYVCAQIFASAYPDAHRKWLDADRALNGPDAEAQLSTVGHLCREAMQAFAGTLCRLTGTPLPDADPARTVARIKACVARRQASLGDAVAAFLDALIVYWGTVNDLVQRQEHGAAKSGRALTLEDGRRVVFQTAIVMYELDRSLVRGGVPPSA
jgi:hypothetical protein